MLSLRHICPLLVLLYDLWKWWKKWNNYPNSPFENMWKVIQIFNNTFFKRSVASNGRLRRIMVTAWLELERVPFYLLIINYSTYTECSVIGYSVSNNSGLPNTYFVVHVMWYLLLHVLVRSLIDLDLSMFIAPKFD